MINLSLIIENIFKIGKIVIEIINKILLLT